MASANGYSLEITRSNGDTFTLVAYWAAPFFCFDDSCCNKEGDRPLLYHAESLEDARRFGGKILNSDFSEYQPTQLEEAA